MGMSLRKVSYKAFIFSVFSRNQEKNEATDLAVSQLRGFTIAITPAHVPGQHMIWASAGQGPSSSSPKQCKLDGRVKISNSVSARSPLTNPKKKIIESAAI